MPFPPSFLEELRSRLPLSEIVGKRIRLTRAGREFKACCPFHNEKSPSFYINDDKQFYHCFGCGAHGDIIGFTMRHDRLSFPEAVESLAGQAGLQVPRDTPVDREKFDQEKRLYQVLERTTAWFEEQLFAPAGREALNYLHGRGLSDEAIRRFRLGFAPNDGQALIRALTTKTKPQRVIPDKFAQSEFDPESRLVSSEENKKRDSGFVSPPLAGSRSGMTSEYTIEELMAVGLAKKSEDRNDHYSFFRNRVMFPVGDRRGRIVAFGGRVLGDGEPKYLNSPDHPLFHKGKLLYGLSRARTAIGQGQPIIVVEGYMDVIALAEAGYSGAVAPLGTALTEDQMVALWKLLPPADARDPARDYSPILCFDGDNAGLRAAVRAMERTLPLLSSAQTIRIATMEGAKDPDDLLRQSGRSAMDAILKQAKPMIDVIWETTQTGRNLRTPEERGAFMTALKQRTARIADETLRKLYHDEIQKRLAEAFSWRQSNEPRTGKPGSWRPPQPPMPLVNRKQPLNPQRLRERALLALMINHPDLFADFGEDLAHIHFSSAEFDNLRQRVIDVLSMDAPEALDAAELFRHLSEGDEGSETRQASLLTEILSEATYMHVGFARPDRPIEQARQGWKSIWNKHVQEQLQADLQSAKRIYADDASDENYTRVLALREQMEHLALMDKDLSEAG